MEPLIEFLKTFAQLLLTAIFVVGLLTTLAIGIKKLWAILRR